MMKTKLTVLYIAALAIAIGFGSGCESSADKKMREDQKAKKELDSLKVVKEKAEAEALKIRNENEMMNFEASYNQQIESNNKQIKEFKERLKASEKSRDKMTLKTIDSLDMRNENLKLKLKNYKTEHSDWTAFKREFEHDMGEIGKALKGLTVNDKK